MKKFTLEEFKGFEKMTRALYYALLVTIAI